MRPVVMRSLLLGLFALAIVFRATAAQAADAQRPIDFNRDVRPVLADNCYSCHGPDEKKRQADLRLDQSASALADRGGYAVVAPGDVQGSELLKRIASTDPELQMPPPGSGKKLDEEQIAVLNAWIEQGAVWNEHWAYLPIRQTPPPLVADGAWPRQPIDRFVLAQLEAEQLSASPDANAETLVRRLSFDLTGLPPSPDDADAFSQAYAKDPDRAVAWYVDRLLASIHFGERMAVYWLDLVRYADTVGYHGDQEHHISPYRDYVIKAFNDNLPFDQFTIEQLAGDLLPSPTMWQVIASGYNRVLQTTHEGGAQDKEYLAKYAADRVRNASQVWLGATMGCAECHDHKYDPYTQKDFYSFAAFFADLTEKGAYKGPDANPTVRPPEAPGWSLPQYALAVELDGRIARLTQQRNLAGADVAAIDRQLADLAARRSELEKQFAPTMISVPAAPRVIRVLPRGDWLDETGEETPPAVPGFLSPAAPSAGAARATRLDLAKWLVSPDNPLTARVFVNRMWMLFFGAPLASADDFGAQGEPPSHPELLDALAFRFSQDWDVKQLIRRLVLSSSYRQSSLESPTMREQDPRNRWLARQGRRRLEAEFVRDSALAVSGLFVSQLGGPSARPYQPAGYYRHLNFPKREYQPDTGAGLYRRGLYTHWQRVYLHPMLKAFDAPSREECTAMRASSNTPLAALALLNDPSFVEAARVFAARIVREGGSTTAERLAWAWKTALSRPPSERELALLQRLWTNDLAEYQADPAACLAITSAGQAPPADDLDRAELAAYTSVARAIFNLSEFITRN